MRQVNEKITILSLLKLDLGITSEAKDPYFLALIDSAISEIQARGIRLDFEAVEDQLLISDYAAWSYRKRTADTDLSKSLSHRLRNRAVKARSEQSG